MPQPNQLFVLRDDVKVTAADLLSTRGLAQGFTENDIRLNMNIALAYMESWLRCVAHVCVLCVCVFCVWGWRRAGHNTAKQTNNPTPNNTPKQPPKQNNSGVGCVPIHNLMEDAATAEISRSQLWQWVRHGARTKEGRTVTAEWAVQLLDDEAGKFRAALGDAKYAQSKFDLARRLLAGTIQGKEYSDFLTTLCYDHIVTAAPPGSKL
jgi:malate synthase